MKNLSFPIGIGTLYLFIYVIASQLGMPAPFVLALFILSPFVVIWMVVRVLKDGKPSKYSFEERFYEDLEYERLKTDSRNEKSD